jgi:hypothetical protein
MFGAGWSLPIATLIGLCAALSAGCGGSSSGGGAPTPMQPTPPIPPVTPPLVNGPAWWSYARDAQHSALGAIASQPLQRILWHTPVDLAPTHSPGGELFAHYGSPVVSSKNTVVIPVKTTSQGAFRLEARQGFDGALVWSAASDYVLPAHNWLPSYNLALTQSNRVYAPGAGGKLYFRDDVDSSTGALQSVVFYGATDYAAFPSTYDVSVFINTPLTVDLQGNVFFGFIVTDVNPANLVSGIARVAADGTGTWVAANVAASDTSIGSVAMNAAPALSPDMQTLYVAVNAAPSFSGFRSGYLLALDSRTLLTVGRAPLIDPRANTPAWINDDGTASPTVGPDGDVYFGVLETDGTSHNNRGWLLHFDASLTQLKTPGSFGWDDTASIVPASAVPGYTGTSTYLLMTKYNNYLGVGTGNGQNRIAVLDPFRSQTDDISGIPVMAEVLTKLGATPDPEAPGVANAVTEWCINTAAIDPLTHSALVNNEDGVLYRWDLSTNTFSESIRLTNGIFEAYTPTIIGPDGAVYAMSNAVLYAIGQSNIP